MVLAGLAPSIAYADKSDVIAKHLGTADIAKAQEKCTKWEASASTDDPRLREVCAQAFWSEAEAADRASEWSTYRNTWAGTSWEPKALEREASAAISELDAEASEDAYLALATTYAKTTAADQARALAATAAFRDAASDSDATRAAAAYPDAPGLPDLVARFVGAFVTVDFEPEEPVVSIVGVEVSEDPVATWVARWPTGQQVPWAEEASRQLQGAGFPETWVAGAKKPQGAPYPVCFDPNAIDGWKIGLSVTLHGGSAFVAAPWDPHCDQDALPVFASVQDGHLTGLRIDHHALLHLPTTGVQEFPWGGASDSNFWIPVLGDPGTPLLVGGVVGQPAGNLFLLHSVSGGMPWYVASGPPPGALALTGELKGSPLPQGWTVRQLADGSLELTGPHLGDGAWSLPVGDDVRVLSPLAQQTTGLGPTPDDQRASPLAPASDSATWTHDSGRLQPVGPAGSQPLQPTAMARDEYGPHTTILTDAGARVTVSRGWTLDLDDDPHREAVMDATVDGRKVRIVYDQLAAGGDRVFVFRSVDPNAMSTRSQVFAFELDGRPYFGWTDTRGSAAWVETIHFDDAGLVGQRSSTSL